MSSESMYALMISSIVVHMDGWIQVKIWPEYSIELKGKFWATMVDPRAQSTESIESGQENYGY